MTESFSPKTLLQDYKSNLLNYEKNLIEIRKVLYQIKEALFSFKNEDEIEKEFKKFGIDLPKTIYNNRNTIENQYPKIILNEPLRTPSFEPKLQIICFENKSYYKGETRDDQIEGYGCLFSNKNDLIYEGYWSKGKLNGFGVLHNLFPASRSQSKTNFHDFSYMQNDWSLFEGEFIDNMREGKGKIEFVNGDTFQGSFKQNLIHGEGIISFFEDKEKKYGIWEHNLLIKIIENGKSSSF